MGLDTAFSWGLGHEGAGGGGGGGGGGGVRECYPSVFCGLMRLTH